jgi:hypothetical protein
MLRTRRRIQSITKFLLLLLLGMQVSFAANAGFQFAPPPQANSDQATSAAPSCHSAANANVDLTRSLCRLHCVTDAQSFAHCDAPSLTNCLEAAPVLVLQGTPAARQIPRGCWHDAISSDPPLAIRFCSFLI